MRAPAPPDPFDPEIETIYGGTILFRVHEEFFPGGTLNEGATYNPGYGRPTRFAFFGDPSVPVLYAATDPIGAVHETVLHDLEADDYLPKVEYETKVLTPIEVQIDLTVASFHSSGLRRLKVYPRDLTDTPATAYPDTVEWADRAHRRGLHGVSYMCRHYNSSMALCLFGDAVPPDALRPLPRHAESRAFSVPSDEEWLLGIAERMGVVSLP